jgi:hypothetical protein
MILLTALDMGADVAIPPLMEGIQVVLSNGSTGKVIRVDASGVIALVQDDFAGGDLTMMEFITQSMS